jgi:hypothetical protein
MMTMCKLAKMIRDSLIIYHIYINERHYIYAITYTFPRYSTLTKWLDIFSYMFQFLEVNNVVLLNIFIANISITVNYFMYLHTSITIKVHDHFNIHDVVR